MMTFLLCAAAFGAQDPDRDLADLSLEELLRLDVTTASRKEQSLMDTPAAVSVIRGEDIRRMGARSIPEALRMAPGMNVARIDGQLWAISARGFSDRFANKLQVLVDGRSVYTPLFSGVFWVTQDTFLEDIDRIEVIRGPGGAVWGANAVNGVVNVITKKAEDTRGGAAYAGGGSEERAFGGVRYGGSAGDNLRYRAFVMGYDRDAQQDPAGGDPADDEAWQGRSGFRTEWAASDVDELTLLGEYFYGFSGTTNAFAAPPPLFVDAGSEHYRHYGGHAVLRWERRGEDTTLLAAQLSYTWTMWETSFASELRNTLDVNVTHRFTPLKGHDLVWGAGYRLTSDDVDGSFAISVEPEEEIDDVPSLFLQDEISIVEEVLKLTLGARAEHNDYSGLELQPTARLSFRPHAQHQVWAAASRAVRTPSRGENDFRLVVAVLPPPPAPPGLTDTQVRWMGSRDFGSEELLAYEAGYRFHLEDALSVDAALFYNAYDELRSIEPRGTTVEGTSAVVLSEFDNLFEARTYGAELAVTWQAAAGWRLYGAYTFLKMNVVPDGSLDPAGERQERQDAQGQFFFRSSMDLRDDVQLDLLARYVGPLPGRDVEAYAELDLRLAWRPRPSLELSLVGQNLLHDEHLESGPTGLQEQATAVERGAYLMALWRF